MKDQLKIILLVLTMLKMVIDIAKELKDVFDFYIES